MINIDSKLTFVHKVMFMVGYYNEFTVVRRQSFCKLFLKENSVNDIFSYDQLMTMSLDVLSIYRFILIILRHYFSI